MNLNQKIEPFSNIVACPKCGCGELAANPVSMCTAGAIEGQAFGVSLPTMPIMGPSYAITTRFCPGGQEPEQKGDNELVETAKIMAAAVSAINPAASKLIPDSTSKINICAGIAEEHLHRTCSNCGFEFLMATKDAAISAEVRS